MALTNFVPNATHTNAPTAPRPPLSGTHLSAATGPFYTVFRSWAGDLAVRRPVVLQVAVTWNAHPRFLAHTTLAISTRASGPNIHTQLMFAVYAPSLFGTSNHPAADFSSSALACMSVVVGSGAVRPIGHEPAALHAIGMQVPGRAAEYDRQ